MILLGVLLIYFDVATAMVVFSLLQFSANMSRVLLWRKFILWPIFFQFMIGGTLAFGIMRLIAFIPDKAVVYLVLGRRCRARGAPISNGASCPMRRASPPHWCC